MTGDVELKGAEKTYRLNFGTNTACSVEETTNRSYVDIMADLRGASPSIRLMRDVIRAALIAGDSTHADMSLEAVGAVIDDLGGWAMVLVGLDSKLPEAEVARLEIRVATLEVQAADLRAQLAAVKAERDTLLVDAELATHAG